MINFWSSYFDQSALNMIFFRVTFDQNKLVFFFLFVVFYFIPFFFFLYLMVKINVRFHALDFIRNLVVKSLPYCVYFETAEIRDCKRKNLSEHLFSLIKILHRQVANYTIAGEIHLVLHFFCLTPYVKQHSFKETSLGWAGQGLHLGFDNWYGLEILQNLKLKILQN